VPVAERTREQRNAVVRFWRQRDSLRLGPQSVPTLYFDGKKGPGRTGQIFVYFSKKSVISCLRQVRPVNFKSTKFCQSLPNFKDAVVLPRSRTNFCQA